MKEFKLKKWYPSLPTEWIDNETIVVVKRDDNHYHLHPSLKNSTRYAIINEREVEENEEFWKEIVEKDYEILSFIGIVSESLYEKIEGNLYGNKTLHQPFNLTTLLRGKYRINSVKRLSDGEVFTLGEGAKTVTSKGSHKIESFKVKQKAVAGRVYDGIDRIWVNWDENTGGNWLDKIEKYIEKEILFTTEDGVDIFEGDSCWEAYDNFSQVAKVSSSALNTLKRSLAKGGRKAFSTEEKALEFIDQNTVLLTTEDGKDLVKGDEYWFVWTDKPAYGQKVFKAYKHTLEPLDKNASWSLNAKYFSSQFFADEYIMLNIPCLSLNEVGQFYKKLLDFSNGNSKGLRELVKSKL